VIVSRLSAAANTIMPVLYVVSGGAIPPEPPDDAPVLLIPAPSPALQLPLENAPATDDGKQDPCCSLALGGGIAVSLALDACSLRDRR